MSHTKGDGILHYWNFNRRMSIDCNTGFLQNYMTMTRAEITHFQPLKQMNDRRTTIQISPLDDHRRLYLIFKHRKVIFPQVLQVFYNRYIRYYRLYRHFTAQQSI